MQNTNNLCTIVDPLRKGSKFDKKMFWRRKKNIVRNEQTARHRKREKVKSYSVNNKRRSLCISAALLTGQLIFMKFITHPRSKYQKRKHTPNSNKQKSKKNFRNGLIFDVPHSRTNSNKNRLSEPQRFSFETTEAKERKQYCLNTCRSINVIVEASFTIQLNSVLIESNEQNSKQFSGLDAGIDFWYANEKGNATDDTQ